jgi:hypothetical protein
LSASQKYDFFVNKQFFNEDEGNYKAYIQHKNLGIGLFKIESAYKNNEEKKQELKNKHFEPVDKEHKRALTRFEKSEENIEELQQQLELEILENEKQIIEVVDYEMKENNKISNNENYNSDLKKW